MKNILLIYIFVIASVFIVRKSYAQVEVSDKIVVYIKPVDEAVKKFGFADQIVKCNIYVDGKLTFQTENVEILQNYVGLDTYKINSQKEDIEIRVLFLLSDDTDAEYSITKKRSAVMAQNTKFLN